MTTEEIKKWMEDKGFDNNALAIDKNHRVSLYLSDVLGEFNDMLAKKLEIDDVGNSWGGYCSDETLKKKRCDKMCDKPQCGW